MISGLLGAALAQNTPPQQAKQAGEIADPTYGGIFDSGVAYIHPDDYVQPENKQDKFDWKLTQVRNNYLRQS